MTRQFNLIRILVGISVALIAALEQARAANQQTIRNASYDPTREFYEDYDAAFATYWKQKTGNDLTINLSNGGSNHDRLRAMALQPGGTVYLRARNQQVFVY